MNKKLLAINLLLFVALLFNSCDEVTSPKGDATNFIRKYSGIEAKEIIIVDDGFIICGTTNKQGNGGENIYLMKISKTGNLIWDKTYGSDSNDRGTCLLQTSDGNLLIGGYTYGFNYHSQQMYLLKTKLNGDILWANAYIHPADSIGWGNSEVTSIIENRNSYIAVGRGMHVTGSMSATTSSKTLCIDKYGYSKWHRTYEQIWGWSYSAINLTNQYSLFTVNSLASGAKNLYFINRYNGKIEKSMDFNSSRSNYFSMINTHDGNIVLCGETKSSPAEVQIDKISESGDYIWHHTFSKYYVNEAYDIKPTQDGGFIIVGSCKKGKVENSDILLIKIDSEGSLSWEKTFDLGMNEVAFSIQQLNDNGYIFAGKSYILSQYGNSEIVVIRTDRNGIVKEL